MDTVINHIEKCIEVKKKLLSNDFVVKQISDLGRLAASTLGEGKKIIFAGNGGSFADSQHISAEFISKLSRDREPLPSVALGTNASSFSAIGNDYGFSQIFARELKAIGNSGDLFVPISTSGKSENIIKAIEIAKSKDIVCFGLVGDFGSIMQKLIDCVVVPSTDVFHIQECHIMIGHIICSISEKGFIYD